MIAEEMAIYLIDNYLLSREETYIGFQPDKPDNCVTFYDITAPIIDESQTLAVDQFGVQILIRNKSYTEARKKSLLFHEIVVGFGGTPFIPNGKMIGAVFVDVAPFSIGRDEKGRSEWSAHYRIRVDSENSKFRL